MTKRIHLFLIAATCAVAALAPMQVSAQALNDQESARQEMEAGDLMSPREIERRIVPNYQRRGYEYLNFEYDARAKAYRLKFIREGRVTFVDVDARTGRVIRRRR